MISAGMFAVLLLHAQPAGTDFSRSAVGVAGWSTVAMPAKPALPGTVGRRMQGWSGAYTAGTVIWLWIALGILLLAAEVYTTAFYAVFLAAGAFAAAVTTQIGAEVLLQTIIGAVVAVTGAVLARPLLLRLVARRVRNSPSAGMPGLVGQSALVTDAVGDEHHPGHVLLGGETWRAITDAPDPLGADTAVTVVSVQGTTLLVRQIST